MKKKKKRSIVTVNAIMFVSSDNRNLMKLYYAMSAKSNYNFTFFSFAQIKNGNLEYEPVSISYFTHVQRFYIRFFISRIATTIKTDTKYAI